jgi:hypothetical protein
MAPSEGVIAVDEIQIRAAITAYLEGALEFADTPIMTAEMSKLLEGTVDHSC